MYGSIWDAKTVHFRLGRSTLYPVNPNESLEKLIFLCSDFIGRNHYPIRTGLKTLKENSPSIIFIDEIDAIATKRFDAQTGADREVQRILLELLNQMDGFDQSVNVKVIMATNRQDTLDPALLRPGRLDRKIEFPLPDRRQKVCVISRHWYEMVHIIWIILYDSYKWLIFVQRLVFSTITSKMNLSDDVDLEDFVARPDKISGADIHSICQEAGKSYFIPISNSSDM